MSNYPKFEVQTGRPETAKIVLKKWNTQSIEEELFPSELEALNVVKQNPVAKFFNDRFIMGCLLSRKMDIGRTIKMLKAHLKWRMDKGYEKIPTWEDIDKSVLHYDFAALVPGSRSKDGNPIIYCKLGNLVPSEMGKNYVKKLIDYILWNNSVGTFLDGMDFHRNGLIFIADLQGVGWKNIDINLQKKINGALMDNFPLRIQKVLIINPPSIINTVISCMRIFMKKKIMDRIQIVDKEELTNFIDEDNLLEDFGGKCEYKIKELIQSLDELNPTSIVRLRSIAKKGKKKSKKEEKTKEEKPKKEKKTVKEDDLNGLPVNEIPPEVVEALKNANGNENGEENQNDESEDSELEERLRLSSRTNNGKEEKEGKEKKEKKEKVKN